MMRRRSRAGKEAEVGGRDAVAAAVVKEKEREERVGVEGSRWG